MGQLRDNWGQLGTCLSHLVGVRSAPNCFKWASNMLKSASFLLLLAWVVALASSLSVLFIGEVLGQMPCQLCWYQRIFMFPLAIILGVGFWWNDMKVSKYALVLALGGGAIALWHLGLYYGVIPEPIKPCTATGPSCTDQNQVVLGVPIPLLSLIAFVSITIFSVFSLRETHR